MLEALTTALGEEAAMTLSAHLPPSGWADVATRHDVDHLEAVMDLRFESMMARLDARFDSIDGRFESMESRFEVMESRSEALESRIDTRIAQSESRIMGRILTAVVGSNLTMGALVLGVLSLAG
jgi:hypothetical protein